MTIYMAVKITNPELVAALNVNISFLQQNERCSKNIYIFAI